MSEFVKIKPKEIDENTFKLIGSDWMLITAGTEKEFNTMTASWGGLGILWHKNVCTIFIRPQRHTYGFVEQSDFFTLSFFGSAHREVLKYCGSHSGRDVDKVAETGITPAFSENGGIYFQEAKLVLECRKLYYQDITPDHFLDDSIQENYPKDDYHRMYIGEIIGCYKSGEQPE